MLGKPQLKGILQNTWLVLHKNVMVIKNKLSEPKVA